MEKTFKNLIKTDFPNLCGSKLLLAVSGGVDSVVMAHLCASAKLDFSIAHCNFNLRGEESDGDEKFVVDLADSLEVEVYTESFDTLSFAENHKISVQMAARDLRYEWFSELSNLIQFDYVLTAHHANDNLETFLINLIRGTGPEGLSGIKNERDQIIRPLLSFTRAQIEAYARKKQYKWREDSSNASDKYMRNKIRNQIVPAMEEINPQLLDGLAKTQQHLQESLDLVEDYISLLYPKLIQKDTYGYAINIDFLQRLPNQKQILYQLLKSFGFSEWNDVYDLLEAQSGKMVLSESHRLIKDRERLLLTEHNDQIEHNEYHLDKEESLVMIPGLGTFHMNEVDKMEQTSKSCIYVSEDKLKFPLTIRKWRKGDYFHPFGMKGKKKLSDFFKDEKFSLPEKEHTWILCSEGEIVWIINHRADNRFAVENSNSKILKIFTT